MRVEELKSLANGREREILVSVGGIAEELLDGKHHGCPRCGGKDRFRLIDEQAGAVFCNQCFNKENGDFLAAIQWMLDCDFREAMAKVKGFLGIDDQPPPEESSSGLEVVFEYKLELLCHDKKMPIDAFRQFNPKLASRGRRRNHFIRIPAYNEKGEVHTYFDMAPKEKGWFKRGKGNSGLFLPGRLPQAGETWLIVEGPKDCAALIGLGFSAVGTPTNHLSSKYAPLFQDVHIIIVPDLDRPSALGADKTAGNLLGIASSVRVARLPGEFRETNGYDVRDVISQTGGAALVREAINAAEVWVPTEGDGNAKDGRPEIMVTLKEGYVTDQVVSSIGLLGWDSPWVPAKIREYLKVYVRAGNLVQVIPSERGTRETKYSIHRLPTALVRERITQACRLQQEVHTKDGEIEIEYVRPPKWLIDAVHDRNWYSGRIRPLDGLIHAPTIRPDGTILQRTGYDEPTALIFSSNIEFPKVPDRPSQEDAHAAGNTLMDVVRDFPFKSDSDRSAWLCLVLSLIGRPCIEGCVPLFALTANIRGAGKSMLVDTASIIAYGHPAARKTYTRDDDEMRKSITAIALEAAPSVLFDNLDRQLGGAALDAALTATTWRERILGKSETTGDLPMTTVWSATGNNLSFGSDVARRVLPIRLESQLESPEERTDFQHEDLLGWVKENRPQLAVMALTFLRAYFAVGCPKQSGGAFGSFESWSQIVRGAVVWAGFDDPLVTREYATSSDESKDILRLLICGLQEADPDNEGLTTSEIERLVNYRPDDLPSCPTLAEAIRQICGDKFNSRRVGRRMGSFVGRVCQGKVIHSEKAHNNVIRWVVRSAAGVMVGLVGYQIPNAGAPAEFTNDVFAHSSSMCAHSRPRLKTGERNPLNPSNPPCRHFDPESFFKRGDKMYCQSCEKYVGRATTGRPQKNLPVDECE